MVKFIKMILFGCETQSLMAVLTLYGGFHAFSTTTLTSFSTCKGNNLLYSLSKVVNAFLAPFGRGEGGCAW
jgi:hypothetical protein